MEHFNASNFESTDTTPDPHLVEPAFCLRTEALRPNLQYDSSPVGTPWLVPKSVAMCFITS